MKKRPYWTYKLVRQADLEPGDWIAFPDGMYQVTQIVEGVVSYAEAQNRRAASGDGILTLPANQPERLLPVRMQDTR